MTGSDMTAADAAATSGAGRGPAPAGSVIEVFLACLRLGLTSFGGPIAHLGYYRSEFVVRRRWLDEHSFADLVGLCQFLPGPASTQTCFSIGLLRAGYAGGLAAWAGFALPSALLLTLFAFGAGHLHGAAWGGLLHGLQVVAVAVVAQAVWSMARNLCPDRPRAGIAVCATLITLSAPTAIGQIAAILFGTLAGLVLLRKVESAPPASPVAFPIPPRAGVIALGLFAFLLVGLPLLAAAVPNHALAMIAAFYRSGALVFGGGHVVLPLLQAAVVGPGWIGNSTFLAGYGAAQAVPGPIFTFAAYLGATMGPAPNGWLGAALCLVAIFLPGLLLVTGMLPFWDRLRRRRKVQAAMRGVNAAVVGLLLAALYTPVWTSAILGAKDFALALLAFALLAVWRLPSWVVVLVAALGGAGLALI